MYFSLTANTDPHLVGAENADECALAHPITTSPFLVSHDVKGGRAQIVRRGAGNAKPIAADLGSVLELDAAPFAGWQVDGVDFRHDVAGQRQAVRR